MLNLVRIVFAVAGLFPAVVLGQQDTVAVKAASVTFAFPQKLVSIQKSIYEKSNLSFLVLHDDENTGVEAAHDFCKVNGGSITELQYGNVRNITFGFKPVLFSFDPNAIFNNEGAYKSLRLYSRFKPSATTVGMTRDLAVETLKMYNPDSLGYIITLHNNTDGNFNIKSYLKGNYLYGTADSIHINPEMDPDDLIFVTEAYFFNYLKEQNINTVLQSASAIDGSLSVYAQVNKIPYLNIEVQDGHKEEHLRLIYVIEEMFKSEKINPVYAVQK